METCRAAVEDQDDQAQLTPAGVGTDATRPSGGRESGKEDDAALPSTSTGRRQVAGDAWRQWPWRAELPARREATPDELVENAVVAGGAAGQRAWGNQNTSAKVDVGLMGAERHQKRRAYGPFLLNSSAGMVDKYIAEYAPTGEGVVAPKEVLAEYPRGCNLDEYTSHLFVRRPFALEVWEVYRPLLARFHLVEVMTPNIIWTLSVESGKGLGPDMGRCGGDKGSLVEGEGSDAPGYLHDADRGRPPNLTAAEAAAVLVSSLKLQTSIADAFPSY
ncbi:unnamed protein product [Lampetra planeri]